MKGKYVVKGFLKLYSASPLSTFFRARRLRSSSKKSCNSSLFKPKDFVQIFKTKENNLAYTLQRIQPFLLNNALSMISDLQWGHVFEDFFIKCLVIGLFIKISVNFKTDV